MGLRSPSAWCRRARGHASPSGSSSSAAPADRGRRLDCARRPGCIPSPARSPRPFVAPRSRYGAGHRGVDFVAATGHAGARRERRGGHVRGERRRFAARRGRAPGWAAHVVLVPRDHRGASGAAGRPRRRPRHRRRRDGGARRGPALRAPGRRPLRRPDGAVRADGPHPADPARPGRRARAVRASIRRRSSADRSRTSLHLPQGSSRSARPTPRVRSTRSVTPGRRRARRERSPHPSRGPLEALGSQCRLAVAELARRARSSRTRPRWRSGCVAWARSRQDCTVGHAAAAERWRFRATSR